MPGEVDTVGLEARPRRGGIGHRSVFTVFAMSIAAAFVGGMLIYFKFVAYGRVAARHLPEDTVLAARIDVETMLISDPIRSRLLPVFDQGVASSAALKPRHDRFRAHTGVELGRDLREVVLGIANPGWVVVFGGKFPRSGLVEGLATTLEEEHTPAHLEGGVLQVEAGPAVGQATDGALIVASDATRLRAALQGGEAYLKLGLPPEGAGGFALLVKDPAPPGFETFARVSGAVQLGQDMAVDAAVRLHDGASADPSAIARDFATLGASAPSESQAQRPLENAQILPRRADEVGVQLSWTRPELDAGAAWLASVLRRQFARASPRP